MAVTPKTTISALSYRENALDMTVNAPSLAALSQLTQFVGKDGLAAEIQSSNPVAAGVEAHLHVHDQSSRVRAMNKLRAWYAACSSVSSAWWRRRAPLPLDSLF